MDKEFLVKPFKEQPGALQIIESASSAIAAILEMDHIVLPEHKKTLLSRMIWKITEAHGKYNTRYCSQAALQQRAKLRHEHVYTRKSLVERLMQTPGDLENILNHAIGCTVTDSEHKRLTRVGKDLDGWGRYEKAKIKVFDRKERKWFSYSAQLH